MLDLIDGTGIWNGGSTAVVPDPPHGGVADLPDVGLSRRRRSLFCVAFLISLTLSAVASALVP